jgi:hypothetical protein
MKANCQTCGAPVGLLAARCDHCGAPNRARRTLLVASASVLLLAAAAGAGVFLALRERPPAQTRPPAAQSATAPGGERDFSWLSKAMQDCDDEAAKNNSVLHFLVIPLKVDPAQAEAVREAALNLMGNATIIPGKDTLEQLKRGALTILMDEHVFGVRDEDTKIVYRWDPSKGVKWVSTADNGAIKRFSMQIKLRGRGSDEAWGNAIERQDGSCYWVNAVADP